MQNAFYIGILIIVTILQLFLLYYYVFLIVTMFKKGTAPYISTFDADIRFMRDNLKLEPRDSILDLGCGDGKALRFLMDKFDIKKGTGYDINHFAINLGKIIHHFQKRENIDLINKKFENADLSKYDYIYVYLFPEQMARIEQWVFENIRPDTIIISNSFQFKENKPFQTIKNDKGKPKIFFYKKSEINS